MKNVFRRLRNEVLDLFELVLVPAIAVVLPWSLCYRLFRRLCRFDILYRQACHEALANATACGWVRSDPSLWLQRCRLVTLIDHADFFLSSTRRDRWMRRHLEVRGAWPAPGEPAVFCTFHWGAGLWALRHIGSCGLAAHAIVARHTRAVFAGRTIQYLYYGARNRENEAALGRRLIEASASPRPVVVALREKRQVIAAVDVPSDRLAGSEPISILGMHTRMPRGLFRIAAESKVPVFVFLTGIRASDGKRTLRIQRLESGGDTRRLMQDAFALLEEAIADDPAAWHFWKVAPRFFRDDVSAPDTAA